MIAIAEYSPFKWFWIVGGDESRAWSSAAGAYVMSWPVDRVTRIASEAELRDVLNPFGLPSPIITVDDYAAAIEAHTNAVARVRGYRDGDRLASYVGSTNAVWAAEAHAFAAWRDGVWAHAYAQMAAVEAGQRPQPSVADLVAELPVISWPS